MLRLEDACAQRAPLMANVLGETAYELFLADPDLMVLAVTDEAGRPVGLLERNAFTLKMAAEFGRALYARRPIRTLMNAAPLIVDAGTPLCEFTALRLEGRVSELMAGFIVTKGGRYFGVGSALALLQAVDEANRRAVASLRRSQTRLEAAKAEADQARAFFGAVVESIPAMVWVKSAADLRYVLLNRAGEEIMQCARDTMVNRTARDVFPADVALAREAQDRAVLAAGEGLVVEEDELRLKNGACVLLRTKRSLIRGKDGAPEFILGVSEDIRERKEAEARISFLAHHDALTGLSNRVQFLAKLEAAMAGARRAREKLAVLCVDLDHFKHVNDTLGHAGGDSVLMSVAETLRACLGEAGEIARLGGDEFALMRPKVESADEAADLGRRIVEALAEPIDIGGQQVLIGASVGVAMFPSDGEACEDLLKKADMAMYRVKAEGRGGVHFFEHEMDERMKARRRIELDLRRALANGEFELAYQPLLRVESGALTGCEALLRWRHPERGLVAPGEFIPLAEEMGLIVPIGEWVLRQACAEAARWPAHMSVAVNLSPVQFRSKNLAACVLSALSAAGLAPHRLELEITESVLLHDSAANLSVLHTLRALGVRISMDDFGTGYSSLSYLRSFPFDKIKIDQSFVRDLPADHDAMAIVRAVTSLGASLGMATTAEGVETEAQLAELRQHGCTEIQGYLISPPLFVGALSERLGIAPPESQDWELDEKVSGIARPDWSVAAAETPAPARAALGVSGACGSRAVNP